MSPMRGVAAQREQDSRLSLFFFLLLLLLLTVGQPLACRTDNDERRAVCLTMCTRAGKRLLARVLLAGTAAEGRRLHFRLTIAIVPPLGACPYARIATCKPKASRQRRHATGRPVRWLVGLCTVYGHVQTAHSAGIAVQARAQAHCIAVLLHCRAARTRPALAAAACLYGRCLTSSTTHSPRARICF